eukprot:4788391-Prymnesium_polylepis.1
MPPRASCAAILAARRSPERRRCRLRRGVDWRRAASSSVVAAGADAAALEWRRQPIPHRSFGGLSPVVTFP